MDNKMINKYLLENGNYYFFACFADELNPSQYIYKYVKQIARFGFILD